MTKTFDTNFDCTVFIRFEIFGLPINTNYGDCPALNKADC